MMPRFFTRVLFAVFIIVSSSLPVQAALPASVATEADAAAVRGGLVVVLGTTDGIAEAALGADGSRLVQGLTLNDAALAKAREAIESKGRYGLVTVVKATTFSSLPYADGLVDLIVIDADEVGEAAPPAAELSRILSPNGVTLTWRKGAWERSIHPRSKEFDDWTHFDYDATGSGQSRDQRIAPPTHVQWRMEVQPYRGWGGNPAGYRPYSAFRVAGGRSFCIENQGDAEMAVTKDKSKSENLVLQARVAANGLPLWQRAIVGRVAGATHIEYQMIADAQRVVFVPEPGKAPIALDAATGKELFSYDIPLAELPGTIRGLPAAYYQLRMDQGTLIVSTGGAIHACDAATGKRKWTNAPKDLWPVFPRLLPGGRVIVQLATPADGYKVEMRWATMPTAAIASVSLADGQEQWRVALPLLEEIPKRADVSFGKPGREVHPTGPLKIGQTMLAGDNLFLFGASGIGASGFPGQVACIDLVGKKLKWAVWTGTWGYNLVVRGDRPYWFTPSTLYTVDPDSGAVSKFFDAPFNNRCNRSAATGEWLINGMGIWVDKKGESIVKSIARSGCAQGPTVAQGMVLYTPNTCWCITQLRGHIALSAEPLRPDPDDATRLRKEGGSLGAEPAVKTTPFTGPIASQWPLQIFSGRRDTDPVQDSAGRSYIASMHEHRIDCRKDGKTIWSFTAGGRITQAPVIHDGALFFGSHDGFAYCLDAATGTLRYRFYAGGAERQIVSHGQLESSWPVYNVTIHQGMACFTAGLHPETGGGIHAWGLDPRTGTIKFHHRLVRSEVKLPAERGKIAPNRVLNRPLTVDADGKLSIIGLSFAHDESADAIQTRIDTMSFKDAARNEGGWTLRGEVPAPR